MPNPLFSNRAQPNFLFPPRGGGGVCAAPKGRLFAPFWSEHGYRLARFWSGIGYGFRGNTEVMNAFIVLIPNE